MKGLLSGFTLPYAEPTLVHVWTELPYACNLAIRRTLFNELGFFRTDLGKSGHGLRASGETELVRRIHNSGWKILYVPNARVRHFVLPQRLDISYLYRRGRGLQETHILLTADPQPAKIARWFVSDLWYAIRMFFWFIVAIVRRKELWFDDYMRFWMVGLRLPLRAKWLIQRFVRSARLSVIA